MGFFSAILGDDRPSKYQTACRVAALILCVKQDIGVRGLITGVVVLNKDSTVAFRGGRNPIKSDRSTEVSVAVQLSKFLTESEIDEPWAMDEDAIVQRLTFSVLDEFSKNSDHFSRFKTMFPRTARCVFIGMSAQYLAAKKRNDHSEMARLVNLRGGNALSNGNI